MFLKPLPNDSSVKYSDLCMSVSSHHLTAPTAVKGYLGFNLILHAPSIYEAHSKCHQSLLSMTINFTDLILGLSFPLSFLVASRLSPHKSSGMHYFEVRMNLSRTKKILFSFLVLKLAFLSDNRD